MRFAESPASFSPQPLPAWARLQDPSLPNFDAGVCAGATLAALDAILRAAPAFGGAWRSRLALTAAAASVRLTGRREDVSDLRDAWFLRRPGDDPGPAGGHLHAWRLLTHTTSSSIEIARRAAQAFGLNPDDLSDILAAIDTTSNKGALGAAADVVAEIRQLCPHAELLGFWLADLRLARQLRWPFPLPLLVTQMAAPMTKTGAGGPQPTFEWEKRVTVAYAQAAAAAIDLAGELFRRAQKLAAVAPTLRAKGAATVVQNLLGDDALAPGAPIAGMSDRGLRRLCDRLVELGVVRELTNRPTFRLYGL
jgi:Protein of unknown function (DUF1403)